MKTAVVGGGPAGCAAAYFPRKHQLRLRRAVPDGRDLPAHQALLTELGHDGDLVPWDAETQVLDDDGQRYRAKFDQVVSFLGMPVLSWRDKLRVAVGVGKTFLSPGPTSCFDGAELAKWDTGDLDSWSRRVLGDRGTRYITEPYMGFLYAVPLGRLSPALFHAVIKPLRARPGGLPRQPVAHVLRERRPPGVDPPGLGRLRPAEPSSPRLGAAGRRGRRGVLLHPAAGRDDAQMPEGVYLAGDYFAHAGIEAAILSGERAAQNAVAGATATA